MSIPRCCFLFCCISLLALVLLPGWMNPSLFNPWAGEIQALNEFQGCQTGDDLAASPVYSDGPWQALPDSSEGLTLAEESGGLTIRPDLERLAFVLQPDPQKDAFTNSLWEMKTHAGRIYLSYGDLWNNRGPVDWLSYDPLAASRRVEFSQLAEEMLGGWQDAPGAGLLAAGQDARQSWNYGNFYLLENQSLQKRRTIFHANHVYEVIPYGERLYAAFSLDGTAPISGTYLLSSSDSGATWQYEVLDPTLVEYVSPADFQVVSQAGVEQLYALLVHRSSGQKIYERNLYQNNGSGWKQVPLPDPGQFTLIQLSAFKEWLVLIGRRQQPGKAQVFYELYRYDGREFQPLPQFSRSFVDEDACVETGGQWTCILAGGAGASPADIFGLYQSQDLVEWERIARLSFPPGAQPASLAMLGGRPWIGLSTQGRNEVQAGVYQLWPVQMEDLRQAVLEWDALLPQGSQLALQLRTAPAGDYAGLAAQPWTGPDGTGGTVYTEPGTPLPAIHAQNQMVQIQVSKLANPQGRMPHVHWVRLKTPRMARTLAFDTGSGLYTAANNRSIAGWNYQSPVFRLAPFFTNGRIFFDASRPEGTLVKFQVRSGESACNLADQPYLGPDGTSSSSYTRSGEALWEGHQGDGWFQYRVSFDSSSPERAPTLRNVQITAHSPPFASFQFGLDAEGIQQAGDDLQVQVNTLDGKNQVMPITGRGEVWIQPVRLTAEESDVHAQVVFLDGKADITLKPRQPGMSRVCARLAGVQRCSATFEVKPAPARQFILSVSLPGNPLQGSLEGKTDEPFSLFVEAVDPYGNRASAYRGTIRCERWSWKAEQLLFPDSSFTAKEAGFRAFEEVWISQAGEWNLVCRDIHDPRIAGSVTVNIQLAEPPAP